MIRVLLILVLVAAPSAASAGLLMTQEKALDLAFPGGSAQRRTLHLTDEEKAAAQSAARARVDSSVVTYYTGPLKDGATGYAFFETNVVRTMPETFMTLVDDSGKVRFVELLSFYEPGDYLPPRRWMAQFEGKPLSDELLVKRGIRNVSGATLTTQAITDGVRRALALWAVAKKHLEREEPE